MSARSIGTDLLVIGGGMAGLAAAARAAGQGAHVTVVEKGVRVGGSSALSAGILWTAPDLPTLRRLVPRGDLELGRALVEGFAPAVRALRDAGVPVSERWDGHLGFGVAYRVDIHALHEHWLDAIRGVGGQVLLETTARRLLTGAGGAVAGAEVVGPGGPVAIAAGAVILATGGFQGDRALVQSFVGSHADRILVRSNPGSVGDGFRMARDAGAGASHGLGTFYGHLTPAPLNAFEPEHYLPLTQYHSSRCILVNELGRRFTDESRGDEVSNQAVLRQPNGRAFLICDEHVRRHHAVGAPYPHGQVVDRFAVAKELGANVAAAATTDELVGRMAAWGVDGPALRRTVEDYDAAARGAEVALDARMPTTPEPLREAPFHAVEVQPTITFTLGGVHADPDGRVLDRDGRPIPGLFAAGADVGGLQGPGYVAGLALGLVFGPRAADAASAAFRPVRLAATSGA